MSTHKTIKIHVICTNAGGEPDVFTTPVIVTEEEYGQGAHYEKAERIARAEGFESPFICLENHDIPRILTGLDRYYPKNRVCLRAEEDGITVTADRPHEMDVVVFDQTWEESEIVTRDLLNGERLHGIATKVETGVHTLDMNRLIDNAKPS